MNSNANDAPDRLLEHAGFVRAVARAVLGRDESAVEDAVQQTWVVALERGKTRRGPLRPWLGGVARLTALALRRRRIRAERRDRAAARAEAVVAVDELAARAEVGRLVVDAVLALEEPYRAVILLRYYDGADSREIAELLDVPHETVRTRLRRGLMRLREDLAERHDEREGSSWRAALLPLLAGDRDQPPPIPPLLPWLAGGFAVKKLAAVVVVASLLLGGALVLRPWNSGEEVQRSEAGPHGNSAALTGSTGDEDPAHLKGRAEADRPAARFADRAPVDLTANDRERDLHGRILKEDGTGLPGAQILVVHHPWRDSGLTVEPDLYDETVKGPELRSAADGSFSIRLAPGQFAYVRVEAEGYATLERARLSAGERVDITMRPGVALRARVKTHDGKPSVGTRLRLYADRSSPNSQPVRWASTDEAGEAVFPDLVPEDLMRLLAFPIEEGQGYAWTQTLTLPKRGEAVEELQLPSGWILTGRVTEAGTGRVIFDARVSTLWQLLGSVTTDSEGRFALPGVTAKWDEAVHVVAKGYARAVVPVKGVRTLDVQLRKAVRVVGRVVSASGEPVADALLRTIGASTFRHTQDYSFSHGRTAADGSFALGGLDPDRAHTLVVKAPGHGKTLVDFDLVEGEHVLNLGDVTLAVPCRVLGRVLDADGNPAPRVQVELKGWNDDRMDRRDPGSTPITTFYGTRDTRNTDDLGRFAFLDVSPGTYTLMPAHFEHATLPVEVVVRAGFPPEEVVLRQQAHRSLLVTVRDEAGEPVPGVDVRVREGQMLVQNQQTGEDGTTRLDLPRQPLSLFAWVADDPTYETVGPVELGPDDTEVSVVIGRVQVFSARLVGPDGKPLPLAILQVQEGEIQHRRFTNGDGVFGLKVKSGRLLSIRFYGSFQDAASYGRQYTLPLAAELHDVSSDAKDVVVHAEAVPMDREASIRLLDPEGNPLPGVEVTPWPAVKGGASKTKTTDAEGRARFEGLPALPLVFYPSITPTESRPWLRPTHERMVPSGEEIVLRMRAGVRIEGRVIVPAGVPFEKVYVYARDPETDAHRAYSKVDDEGRFTLIVDPADGPSRVRVTHYDGRGGKHEAVVEDVEAGRTDVTVTLTTE